MRTLITFILRLWVDPAGETPAWEGQVECVADGTRVHVRGPEELERFVAAKTTGQVSIFAEQRPCPCRGTIENENDGNQVNQVHLRPIFGLAA